MIRLNSARTSMSHQNGMLLVLSGGNGCLSVDTVLKYWPCQEMMPRPISQAGSHVADFQSSGGPCGAIPIKMPMITYPITRTMPSFQTASNPEKEKGRLA